MKDKEGVIEHLREIEEAMEDWERYQSIPLDEIKKNRDKKNMVLHILLVSIQATIDLGNHLIAEYGFKKPSTYRETFEILSAENLIPSKLGKELADLAGFRNLMVHIYWKLNLEEVYEILQKDLDTIKKFKRIVKDLLREK